MKLTWILAITLSLAGAVIAIASDNVSAAIWATASAAACFAGGRAERRPKRSWLSLAGISKPRASISRIS